MEVYEMNEAIKNICMALKEEADAIISYTDKIESSKDSDTEQIFETIRLDEVEHVQNLCLELTRIITSSDSEQTEQSEQNNE